MPGLRREEVAVLAGVSTDWYVRLERGHIADVSDDVLHAVARALRLDDAELSHLHDLARAARPTRTPRRRTPTRIRPSLQWTLDAMTGAPAIVRNGCLDILAANNLGRALYSQVYDTADGGPVNIARFQFLDPRAPAFQPDWEAALDTTVAIMRTEAGRDPDNRRLTDLVGELATRSDAFRRRWAGHDVRLHHTGAKTFVHPYVGRLDLAFETVDLPTDDLRGLNLTMYTAEPGTPSADAVVLLAGWAAAVVPEHQSNWNLDSQIPVNTRKTSALPFSVARVDPLGGVLHRVRPRCAGREPTRRSTRADGRRSHRRPVHLDRPIDHR